MKEPLADVPQEDIPKFLDLCRDNFPDGVHAYSHLRTLLLWEKKNQDLCVKILGPDGDYRKGVIFYAIHNNSLVGSVYANDEESSRTLQNALQHSKLIPLRYRFVLTCLTKTSFGVVEPLLDTVWSDEKNNFRMNPGLVFWLPWQEAKQVNVEIPEGVEIRYLNPSHADQIDAVWPNRHPGSKDQVAEMIDIFFGVGVFRGEELLSWALMWFYGGIGTVQTEEKEKNKGYGRAVVKAITKEFGNRGWDVHLNVVEGNTIGEAFFRSLGFKFAFNSVWVFRGLEIFPKNRLQRVSFHFKPYFNWYDIEK